MSLKIPPSGFLQLLKGGYKHQQGVDDVVLRNIDSVEELCKISRTSFGPNGFSKIIVNHLEKLFVTNDAATIVKELDVIHPAAKILVQSSRQQETTMGDGTNLVIVLTGELLKQARHMFTMGIHIADIITGYRLAMKTVLDLLPNVVVDEIKNFSDENEIKKGIKSVISSKKNGFDEFLSDIVSKAIIMTMPKNPKDFNVDSVRVVRILGASIYDSGVVPGMLFPRVSEGSTRSCTNAKIAIFTCPLDVSITETKGTVLITKVQEILNFSKEEEEKLETLVKAISDAGINVVITGSTVGDLALHFMNKYNILVFRVSSKFDLRRLAKVTGTTALAKIGVPTKEEIGSCSRVYTKTFGGECCTIFDMECEKVKTSTIYLRGGTQGLLEDIERGIDDAVAVTKDLTTDPRLLPGAGAAEMELSVKLEEISKKIFGIEQYSIIGFAKALEIVPSLIAETSGLDSVIMIADLHRMHSDGLISAGVNINSRGKEDIENVTKLQKLYDCYAVKKMAFELAVMSTITILSVDQIIMSKPAGGPKPRENTNWDDD